MRNTADVTGDKPIAVWSQVISGVNAINPLVAFYDIHVRKREVLLFYSDTTRDYVLQQVCFYIQFFFVMVMMFKGDYTSLSLVSCPRLVLVGNSMQMLAKGIKHVVLPSTTAWHQFYIVTV
jgi:hypothetical protein